MLQGSLRASATILIVLAAAIVAGAQNQTSSFVLERNDRTIALEPYADNIVRITLSTAKSAALGAPGYGIVGTPTMTGWTQEREADGSDVIRSGRLIVRVAPANLPPPHAFPLDALNQSLRDHYFGGGGSGQGPYNDIVSVATSSGKPLLKMWRWSMFPNRTGASPANAGDGGKDGPGYRVSATFDSPQSEHYYGLGQQQQGFFDLRDHRIPCWHDYGGIGGENVCVPFMVSSRGYGLIWDNPS
ncbi:MAG: alpha-glucosidase, partial [Terracidiphilus sp.]